MEKQLLSFETSGTIIAIDEAQTFASGFSKREFVIEVPDGNYPQDIKFEMHKDRADILEAMAIGQEVTVAFNLRGNEYNGKYYVNMVAWKVVNEEKEPPQRKQETQKKSHPLSENQHNPNAQDDIPF